MDKKRFSKTMSITNFEKAYWYKTELQEICKKIGLPTYGTKYELSEYIKRYLNGEATFKIKPIRKNNRSGGIPARMITPKTKILKSGFSLNSQAREFFRSYYKMKKFSFKKSMGIKMREIEASNDNNATVQDLIDTYEKKDIDLSTNKEEQTYQWNNFVKDFRKDPLSRNYKSSMKVASILWKRVRESDQEKKYSRDLLNRYESKLTIYLKDGKDKRK